MSCDELLRRLTDYAEGVLDAPLCAEVERHIDECLPCADLKRDLEDLTRLCRQSSAPRLPEGLRRRIERLLRERS